MSDCVCECLCVCVSVCACIPVKVKIKLADSNFRLEGSLACQKQYGSCRRTGM